MADADPWYETKHGPKVVIGYAVVTVAVIVYSTGLPAGLQSPHLMTEIPPAVYLYSFLGGMTYAFTSIVARFERGFTGVVKVGLRAVAALPLAAGVFLLAGPLGLPTGDPRIVGGLSFLVGLYVSVTLKALGGLADRLFTPSDAGSEADEPETGTPATETDASVDTGTPDAEGGEPGSDETGPASPTA